VRFLDVEAELIGMDHCRLGMETAARIGLESWIFPAILHHHRPTQDSDLLTRVTAVASAFCTSQGLNLQPRRSVAVARGREIEEIARVLLPALSAAECAGVLGAMERSVRPLRPSIRQAILEWQVSSESRKLQGFARQPLRVSSPSFA
jgi:hypothetical protein